MQKTPRFQVVFAFYYYYFFFRAFFAEIPARTKYRWSFSLSNISLHYSYSHFGEHAHVRSLELFVDDGQRGMGIGDHVQSDDGGHQDEPTVHVLGHVAPARLGQ